MTPCKPRNGSCDTHGEPLLCPHACLLGVPREHACEDKTDHELRAPVDRGLAELATAPMSVPVQPADGIDWQSILCSTRTAP